ncbi:MAG: hypothetical protein NTW94_09280 [Legionellales bacterium]|nr:hypothetical protein [Legionellales bacterium]
MSESLQNLSARMPELLWKLSTKYSVLNATQLPRGLFKQRLEMTPQALVDEVDANLGLLKKTTHELSAHYLAGKVSQQIHVLVRLCQRMSTPSQNASPSTFGISSITTRQTWLSTLQMDIDRLNSQQLALTQNLEKLQEGCDLQAQLNLQSELAQVERSLTLSQETLSRATRY